MFQQQFNLKSCDVDYNRNIKLSTLLKIFQEISIAHTEALHFGRDKTLDKGLIWVVSRLNIEINRLPIYDEDIIVSTAPGKTLHTLIPRFYSIKDKNGDVLIRACAIWALVDYKTRKMVDPTSHKITIAPEEEFQMMDLFPSAIKKYDYTNKIERNITFSDLDLNGHMNNTRYADILMDILNNNGIVNKKVTHFKINYFKEAIYNEQLSINYYMDNHTLNILGTSCDKDIFSAEISF